MSTGSAVGGPSASPGAEDQTNQTVDINQPSLSLADVVLSRENVLERAGRTITFSLNTGVASGCKEVSVTMIDEHSARIEFLFNGNNLPESSEVLANAQNAGDTSIAFTIAVADDIAGDQQSPVKFLQQSIKKALKDFTDIDNSTSVSLSDAHGQASLLEHQVIQKTLGVFGEYSQFTNVSLNNAQLEAPSNSNASDKIAGSLFQRMQSATLGNDTIAGRHLRQKAPDMAEAPDPVTNSIIRNFCFIGINGQFNNCEIDRCDVTCGHIHIETDQDTTIKRLAARGACIHGEVNGKLSGDFRDVTFGDSEWPLGGVTFELDDKKLSQNALDNLSNFVCDLNEKSSLIINGRPVAVKTDAHEVRLSALLANSEFFHLSEPIESFDALKKHIAATFIGRYQSNKTGVFVQELPPLTGSTHLKQGEQNGNISIFYKYGAHAAQNSEQNVQPIASTNNTYAALYRFNLIAALGADRGLLDMIQSKKKDDERKTMVLSRKPSDTTKVVKLSKNVNVSNEEEEEEEEREPGD